MRKPLSHLPRLLLPALFLGASLPAYCVIQPELMAKFIKVIATNSNSAGRVDIKDADLVRALSGMEVSADKNAKVAYASTEGEVKTLLAAGKMIICNRLELLPVGGSIAIVEEDGKPAIYLHTGHIAQSGAKVSAAILKIGKQNF